MLLFMLQVIVQVKILMCNEQKSYLLFIYFLLKTFHMFKNAKVFSRLLRFFPT